MRTERRGDTLVVSATHVLGLPGWSDDTPRVTVTAPALRAVRITGSADVDLQGVSGRRFDLAIAGSGDVHPQD